MFRSKNPSTKRNCSYYSIYSWGGALSIENNTLYMFRTLGCIGMHRCLHQNQPSNSFCPIVLRSEWLHHRFWSASPSARVVKMAAGAAACPEGQECPCATTLLESPKRFSKEKTTETRWVSVEGVGWYWCIRQIRLNPEMVEQRWDAVACGGAG